MKLVTKWSLMVVMMSTIFFACDRANELDDSRDEELGATEEILDAENMVDEDVSLTEDALNDISASASGRSVASLCAEITVDSVNHVITLDFGSGCVGPYGRSRSGKIVMTYGGEFNDGLANRIITFEDYVVNNKEVTGSIEVGNYNQTTDGTYTATRTMNNYTVTFPNGTSKTILGATTYEIIEGYGDYDVSNNVVLVTGSYKTTTTFGATYTYTIVEPVKLSYACLLSGNMLRVEGLIEIKRTNAVRVRTKTIDYGEGCDDSYTVSIDSELIEVEG
ncbi:hypothetical protein N6H18_11030 [Reichenbachiella agarivorans]|uniref:Lipoprotein n=1 Tax=Reichenbachiella agarivorans TaxID=2979464 RepID=A0ABY6CRG5_9BACT|nr:hypothetical protein [Reichenbachiella agarivorans]UXP30885.1 hypothetical protein N6H18_11030 [Reichenbachiella agarivorans]